MNFTVHPAFFAAAPLLVGCGPPAPMGDWGSYDGQTLHLSEEGIFAIHRDGVTLAGTWIETGEDRLALEAHDSAVLDACFGKNFLNVNFGRELTRFRRLREDGSVQRSDVRISWGDDSAARDCTP